MSLPSTIKYKVSCRYFYSSSPSWWNFLYFHASRRCLFESWLLSNNFSMLIDTIFSSFRELNGIEEFFKYQTNLTLLTKVHLVKATVFPVVTYRCDSWTINQAECQRINAFELWRWKRVLRVPWTARRSNQSILKETNPKYALEGLMLKLKLKLQYFGTWYEEPTQWKRPWCWERLKAKGEAGSRGWDG